MYALEGDCLIRRGLDVYMFVRTRWRTRCLRKRIESLRPQKRVTGALEHEESVIVRLHTLP
jgi:hypothetical protein